MNIAHLQLPTSDSRPPTTDYRPPAFPFPPSTPRASREAAFSLTEVVIALGIFAISMVGILALFPVASATGRESSEETQAAILAQTILDDAVDAANRRGMSNSFVISGPNTIQTGTWTPLSLVTNVVRFVGYDIIRRSGDPLMGVGMMGDPIALKAARVLTTNDYANPAGIPNLAYLARIEVATNPSVPRLTQISVQIESPANVGPTNRRTYFFSTLIHGP